MSRYVIFLSLGLFFSAPAFSWECGWYENEQNKNNTNWADIVFDGKVKATREVLENGELVDLEVTFEIIKLYKGVQKNEVTLTGGLFSAAVGDGVGYPFFCGETYHVNARKNHFGRLHADRCMRVKPLSSNAMNDDDLEDTLLSPSSKASKEEKDKLWKRMLCPASP